MSSHAEAKFEIKSWDEQPYLELAEGRKFNRATVVQVAAGDIQGEVSAESLMYYRADGTATFSGFLYVDGRLGDRPGSFVLRSLGEFDGQTARSTLTVVPGSGTGDLTGLTGTGESVSRHEDYPNQPISLDYDLG